MCTLVLKVYYIYNNYSFERGRRVSYDVWRELAACPVHTRELDGVLTATPSIYI